MNTGPIRVHLHLRKQRVEKPNPSEPWCSPSLWFPILIAKANGSLSVSHCEMDLRGILKTLGDLRVWNHLLNRGDLGKADFKI